MAKTGRHPISLPSLVTATANWVASQPLSSDEMRSVKIRLGDIKTPTTISTYYDFWSSRSVYTIILPGFRAISHITHHKRSIDRRCQGAPVVVKRVAKGDVEFGGGGALVSEDDRDVKR